MLLYGFILRPVVTVAVLHIVNSIELPVAFFKSYPVYAGVQDALVQWWYGHNAVAFFLTTPYLGLMYYFLPKAAIVRFIHTDFQLFISGH